jgi:hypothetical protein
MLLESLKTALNDKFSNDAVHTGIDEKQWKLQ